MEGKIKILILEDLSSDVELAERELKAVLNHYETVITDSEQGFIKALENFKPDLVISDYMLPSFNGMKALQITREKEEFIPFIILTGSMNEETAVECMKAGADDYVIKEHIKRLGPAILGALDKKKIRQERRQAEDQLKESEENYRLIFESTGTATIMVDEHTTILQANTECGRVTGYTPKELVGTSWTGYVYKEDLPKLLEKAKVRIKDPSQVPTKYEVRLINANKEIRNTILSIGFIPDSHRSIVSIIDITKRKQAEKELIKLSTAVEQSPSVITITDTKGKIEYVNPKFIETTGYSFDEAIGQNPRILKSGEHPVEMYKELWETISSGKTYRCEMHNKRKNGELFWESASISPIFDAKGKIIRYVKVAEDITIQKRNEQIQSIIHHISNAVITSHSLEDFLQMVKEELGGLIDTTNFLVALYDEKTDLISLPLHHDEIDQVETFPVGKTLTHYVIKTGKSLLAKKSVKEKLIKSGAVEQVGHPAEVWLGVPLKNENDITGIIAVQSYDNENAYDEADVKMLEIISHQISISLERKKAEHDLKLALEKAQESDRLKTAFLMNMSHEIRTPMNGILGFTELLKEPHLSGEEKDEYIAIIDKSGHRMLNTINDIIDISRIEAGQVKIIQSEVSLNQILEEQFNFFYPEAKSKGLELFYKPTLSEKEANIVTDQHKLEGILSNLIKNAIKYTEKGSITLACSINKEKDSQFLEFSVEDTGIGIPSDRIEAVFNRFEQADIADTRAYQGSGLGLAISKSYVEMLGGKIGVKSKEGKGSTFSFTIPYINLHKEEVKRKGEPLTEDHRLFNNLSLMVAEDDESNTRLFKMIFKNRFKKITYTRNGKETIEQCRKNPDTDIILMDIKMPDLNGYKATREIRKFNPNVIIIAQTAFGLAGDREKALEAGCTDYISKPIKKEALFDMIRKYLSQEK